MLNNDDSLVCEAGTGTGKTFAYLVPVLMSGKRVIISTGTKHLQDQLYYKDLPIVRKALNVSIVTALLKGRANYLCLEIKEVIQSVLAMLLGNTWFCFPKFSLIALDSTQIK